MARIGVELVGSQAVLTIVCCVRVGLSSFTNTQYAKACVHIFAEISFTIQLKHFERIIRHSFSAEVWVYMLNVFESVLTTCEKQGKYRTSHWWSSQKKRGEKAAAVNFSLKSLRLSLHPPETLLFHIFSLFAFWLYLLQVSVFLFSSYLTSPSVYNFFPHFFFSFSPFNLFVSSSSFSSLVINFLERYI